MVINVLAATDQSQTPLALKQGVNPPCLKIEGLFHQGFRSRNLLFPYSLEDLCICLFTTSNFIKIIN